MNSHESGPMRKLLLLSLALILTSHIQAKKTSESSEIPETDSYKPAEDDSGISESISSKTEPEYEYSSESAATTTKKKVRSSKFPLQFTRSHTSTPSSAIESSDTKSESEGKRSSSVESQTVGKKIYKDVGFRKNKLKKAILKEKRRDTTVNPKKRSRTKAKVKVKKRKYTGENVFANTSDLNFPSNLFSVDPVRPVTVDLNKVEDHIDRSKASEILGELKKEFQEIGYNESERSVASIFKPSNHTEESEEISDYTPTGELDSTYHRKRQRLTELMQSLKQNYSPQINEEDRRHYRKVILDHLRNPEADEIRKSAETAEDVSSEDTTQGKTYNRTTKNPLASIEKAYGKALKKSKKLKDQNQTNDEILEYVKPTFKFKTKTKIPKSKTSPSEKEVKDKGSRQREKRPIPERSTDRSFHRTRYSYSRERYARRYGSRERYRPPYSRERYRDRYRDRYDSRDRYRDRYRQYSRERYRPRYSRERYRDRQDSRERYSNRGSSREKYRYRGQSREKYGNRGQSKERYTRSYRERQTKKKWYSHEEPTPVYPKQDSRRETKQFTERGRAAPYRNRILQGANENREKRETTDSFDAIASQITDENDSTFKKFMKNREMRQFVSKEEK